MNFLRRYILGMVLWITIGLCIPDLSRADTTFVPAGSVEGQWNLSGSPYVIQGNTSVLASDTLVISSGVRVYFNGSYSMLISGYLAIEGAFGDSVKFTTDTLANPARWRGLSFSNANISSFIRYAVFENSLAEGTLSSDSLGGAIYVSGGTTLRIEHCSFVRNRAGRAGGGIYATASMMLIDSCEFVRNESLTEGGGLYLNNSTSCSISYTEFFGNSSTTGSGGGVYIRGTTGQLNHCLIDSNYSRRNGGGIMFSNSPFRIDSSEVRNNHGQEHGGGISLENAAVQIYDCLLDGNYTTNFDGGGIYLWESSPHLLRCRILNNHSADDGGGIHNYRGTSSGVFEQCEVRGNTANGEGGGIWVTFDGAPTFIACAVKQNTAGSYGGGVFLRNNAHPLFSGCDIDSNSTLSSGGGMSIRQSQPIVVDCRIRSNTADAEGGGVHLWEAADAVFNSCEISNNYSDLNGGGISTNQSTLNATNCLIVKNQSAALGGGMATANSSKIELLHCTIGGSMNGGMRLESTVAEIENTIVTTSTGSNIYFGASSSSRIAYSLLHGNIQYAGNDPTQGPFMIGTRVTVNANGDSCDTYFNISADPEFADTANGDWGLTANSPAIGTGNWNTLTEDKLANARPQPLFTLPDMGAIESVDGFSPSGLFGSLAGIIGPGTIKVVADVVVEDSNTLMIAAGTTLLFCGSSGMDVKGTVIANGIITDSVTFTTDTLINPGRWRGIKMSGNAGSSVFEFVSILDSRAISTNRTHGGAIHMTAVSPSFSNCSMKRHEALQGGAVFLEQSSPNFVDCYFEAGSADSGGVFCARLGSAPILDRCVIKGGVALAGGAYLAQGATGQLLNCRFENNSSTTAGGAVFLASAPATIRNNLFLNNSSVTGGAIWLGSTSATIEFNTIAGNVALDGAGIYMRFGSTQVKNNIVAENQGDGIYFFVAPTSVIRYNCVASNDRANFAFFGNSPSQGPVGLGALDSLNANGDPCDRDRNIQLNPLWVSGAEQDYYLAHTATGDADDSPCVNAGDPAITAPTGTTRTDYSIDIPPPDQGYHGPQFGEAPNAVDNLVIHASSDSLTLSWSYDGSGIFKVMTDTVSTGSFSTYVAITADTFIVLPFGGPVNPRRGYFHVIVEH